MEIERPLLTVLERGPGGMDQVTLTWFVDGQEFGVARPVSGRSLRHAIGGLQGVVEEFVVWVNGQRE